MNNKERRNSIRPNNYPFNKVIQGPYSFLLIKPRNWNPTRTKMSLDKDPVLSELYRTLISASHILHYHK
jgi:hypothetical protein